MMGQETRKVGAEKRLLEKQLYKLSPKFAVPKIRQNSCKHSWYGIQFSGGVTGFALAFKLA
jgi:hypothetical protein